jgi:tripartite-type tricarboxylate transporter receptor subunit TctC
MRRQFLWLVAATLSTVSHAQVYPSRVVRIVVPYATGGNTDLTARLVASRLSEIFGKQFIVENRPGGATNIGSALVARAPADGYTLLMGGASNAINMSLYRELPYDTVRDFAPIVLCVTGATVLAVRPSLAQNLNELLALARARPGRLNFASSGQGSATHMAGELLKLMTGIQIVHVPYKGNAPALADMLGGQVEMVFSGVPALLPHLQSGRLRGIAIGSLKRFASIPEVPTFDELGLAGYESTTWFGLLAPAKTPRDIVVRLNVEVGRVLGGRDLRERLVQEGLEASSGTPEQFAQYIDDEIAKYARLVKVGQLKVD